MRKGSFERSKAEFTGCQPTSGPVRFRSETKNQVPAMASTLRQFAQIDHERSVRMKHSPIFGSSFMRGC